MSLEKSNKEGINRRKLLLGGLAGAALVAAGTATLHQKEKSAEDITFLDVEPHPRPYPMRTLARVWKHSKTGEPIHQKFNGELSRLTGIRGEVPGFARIDFKYQMAQMWKHKLGKIKARHGMYPEGVVPAVHKLFGQYDPDTSEKMDILAYQGQIGQSIEGARSALDLHKIKHLESFKRFEPEQLALLQALEKRITSMSQLAYSLTEILPTTGEASVIGVEVYDFLLKNAGREYLENGATAAYDSEFSWGPYQFTPGVFRDERTKRAQGAGLINRICASAQIPKTIGELRGNDHHKTAYLLSVHNLALLVRRLRENRSGNLMKSLPHMPSSLVTEFIAAAHHSPDEALTAFEKYVDSYAMYQKDTKKYIEPDFASIAGGRISPYILKTRSNARALRTYIAAEQVKVPSL